jgi:hypothetical protein
MRKGIDVYVKFPVMGKKRIKIGALLCSFVFTAVLSAQQDLGPYNINDLGPHNINGQGCLTCHSSTSVDPGNVAGTFLWGNFTGGTYATDGGGMLTVSQDLTDEAPGFHSATCLACHDGSIAQSGTMQNTSLTHDHPFDIPYVPGSSGHWPGNVTLTGISFTPSNFDSVYGRSLPFYVSAGLAYVECSTCHDPHHYTVATVSIKGQTYTKPTAHFVRGWFDSRNPSSNSASQFCRSCHYELSNEAFGVNIPTT